MIVPICIRSTNHPTRHRADAPTILITVVPICLRSTDRLIDELYVRPLSPPDACTVLLPESDNCCANTPATRIDNDYTAVPIVDRTIVLIRLRSRLPSRRYACDLP